MAFLKFLKSKGVLLAALQMVIYGIIIFAIYFIGYKPVPNHVTDLPISIVNQDHKNSELSSQIKDSLHSFKTVHQTSDLKQAKRDLKNRKSYLLITIPSDFTDKVQANQHTELKFYINEANQTVVVNTLKSVSQQIGNTVNNQVIVKKGQAILTQAMVKQMQQQVQATANQSSSSAMAAPQQQLQGQVKQASAGIAHSVGTKIVRVNKVRSGLNHALAPFFISLAAYLSALMGALILYGTYAKFAKQVGRFKSFAMLQGAMLILSMFGAIVVTSTLVLMTGRATNNFWNIWVVHTLEIMGAYNLNLVFILLLGQMGSAINIIFTMLQVVAGAGMVPAELLNGFFKAIHGISPMFYSIMSDYDLLYGNIQVSSLLGPALMVALGYIVLNTIIVSFRKKQPIMKFEELA